MQCGECSRENREDARFCDGCGAPLAAACPECGRELRSGARFCDGCGRALGATAAAAAVAKRDPREYTPRHLAAKILDQKSALEGERKFVTALFADLCDSTPLAERVGAEEMHALMDRCFGLILEQVHHYEGTVNQFLGDGVLALFGAPIALEQAPQRAVLTALGIQRALETLDEEVREKHGAPFRMRIGIHSGSVVVGRIGDDLRMDYTAVGDTTNLAARLEQAAWPGAILISDTTEEMVSGYFEVRALGALDLKGVSHPVRTFEVLAERAVSGRIEAAQETGLTPYVGRTREFEALRDGFESAREDRGRLALLVGEAGLGKSRLLYEFRRSLAAEPHLWFEGRCSAYGSSTPFQCLADGLRRRFHIEERDDDETALAKLAAVNESRTEDMTWTLPLIRHVLSLPVRDERVEAMDAVTRRAEIARAIQTHILYAAEHQPVVMVIEDLHWIDPASEQLLTFLANSVPSAKLLMICSYRPGYEHPFGDRSYQVRLALQPLSAGDMTAMTGSVLDADSMPEELRDLIARKAEGNPFFVEEVTKSLLEEGALRRVDGRVELTRELSAIAVPDRIQDVLLARIDRLDEQPKRAIQIASVIGREFALRLLAKISEAGDAVRDVVDDLSALELIYEKAGHPELAFMFKHALTHDVAYGTVLDARRKVLHRIVGTAIEELYADRLSEHYEALAHHYGRGEVWDKALEYHERAAEKAIDSFANASALEHLGRALEIAERVDGEATADTRVRLLEQTGRVALIVNRYAESAQAYEAAARAGRDPEVKARNLMRGAYSWFWGHQMDAASALIEEGLAVARACGSRGAEAMGLCVGAFSAVGTGAFDTQGAEDARRASELARACDDPEALVLTGSCEAIWLDWSGDFEKTVARVDLDLDLMRDQRMVQHLILAHFMRGKSLCGLGRYAESMQTFLDMISLCERVGDRALRARFLNSLGWIYTEVGAHERAVPYNRASAELAEALVAEAVAANAPEVYCNAQVNLAVNLEALGDPEGALEALAPVGAELAQDGDPWLKWRYAQHHLDALARVALQQGDPEQALRLATREVKESRLTFSRKIEARALELSGRALLVMDRRREAAEALRQATARAEEIGYPPVQWRAHALQAEIARRSGNAGEAERLAAAAGGRIEALAKALPDPDLARDFRGLAARMADDPIRAWR